MLRVNMTSSASEPPHDRGGSLTNKAFFPPPPAVAVAAAGAGAAAATGAGAALGLASA